MNIGARTGCWSGGWKNPYVTDGLVMMYDGEWNAGPGKHDPSAQQWFDLSGSGYHLTPDYDSTFLYGPEWTDNALKYNARPFRMSVTGLSSIYDALESAANVEAVYDFSSVNADGGQPVANFYLTTPTRLLVIDPANNQVAQGCVLSYKFYDWSYYYGSAYLPKNRISEEVYGPHTACFTIAHPTTGGNHGFINNEWVCSLPGLSSYYRTYDGLLISCDNYVAVGKNHCVRVYDRPLTDKERTHNYLIDKSRFNVM